MSEPLPQSAGASKRVSRLDPSGILAAVESAEIFEDRPSASRDARGSIVAAVEGAKPLFEQRGQPLDADASPGVRRSAGIDRREINLRLARFPLTDLGNAERFVERHGGELRFCPEIGWLAWDSRRWARDGAEETVKRAEHATARAIQDEAAALSESGEDVVFVDAKGKETLLSDRIAAWGRTSESATHLSAISKRASAMLAIRGGAFDADPMKFNVWNGTLVIRKRADGPYVERRPHDPADYITKISPVVYDPDATCPRFDLFMDETHPPEADAAGREMQRFLDQWAGLSLTGDTREQKLTFHYGRGRNGKSVFVKTIAYIAGDYADSVAIESFLDVGRARAGGQATPDIAKLPGIRMLMTSEPGKGDKLDEAFIKLFTGGDQMTARHLNRDFFSFTPQAKLTMQGNFRPAVRETDEGLWNRLLLVPWGVYFPPEARDPALAEKLRAEASGILNRLLDGLCQWLDHGLQIPAKVQAATADYRSDSDPLGRFLSACTRQALGARVQASDIYAVFVAWAKANGESVWSMKGFGAAMKERGVPQKKSVNIYWLDVELTKMAGDFGDGGDGAGSAETN